MAPTMTLRPAISQGRARFTPDGLRCANERAGDEERRCNKLICKPNGQGQTAGKFRCDRCKQDIEVILVSPKSVA